MVRPRAPIGTFGDISFISASGGQFRARPRFRDDDRKVRRVTATGVTKREAARNLKRIIAERTSMRRRRRAVLSENAGIAESSARREYERRKAKDEERLRQRWGKLGGIAVALSDERQSTKAWATGAIGEERLGAWLDSLVSESVAVLHDRRIPGTKANFDHVAITRLASV
jgi:hypothetical protein